jgi:hypothetical protein
MLAYTSKGVARFVSLQILVLFGKHNAKEQKQGFSLRHGAAQGQAMGRVCVVMRARLGEHEGLERRDRLI